MIYPYSCIYKKQRQFFVWESRETDFDIFRKYKNSDDLIICDSVIELKEKLGAAYESNFCEEISEMNFDKFWISVRNLKTGRASSIKTCNVLLDGWNFIEDLIKTIGTESDLLKLRSPVLNKLYKKLFYGNNLAPVTPENYEYHPIWTNEEIIAFRQEMRWAWHEFFPENEFNTK